MLLPCLQTPLFWLRKCLWVCTLGICVAFALDFEGMEQSLVNRFGPQRVATFREWQSLVNQGGSYGTADQLRLVNDFFNRRIYFMDDMAVWGQTDYWATPLETLGMGRGDCDDFAIAKYFSLKSMGISVSHLRLVYVKARQMGPAGPVIQAHMVLAYYPTPGAEPLILDNLNPQVMPAGQRPDLTPIYSFNSQGIWHGTGNQAANGQLSRLQDMLARARADGFN